MKKGSIIKEIKSVQVRVLIIFLFQSKKKSSNILNKIQLDYSTDWNLNHKKTIGYNYKKAKFFQDYWKFFDKLYNKKFEFLIDLNLEIIKFILKELEIKTKTILQFAKYLKY